MKFVQDALGWSEISDKGEVIGHLTHYQHELYEQAQLAHLSHEWFIHFAFWFQKNTDIDLHYLFHSALGGVLN